MALVCALAACAVIGSEERPAPGGSYREAVVGQPLSLNPLLHPQDPIVRDVSRLAFAGLVRVRDGQIDGDLAASWTISDDGRLYTFNMKREATWHDGRPVTSADVLATVALLQSPTYTGPREIGELWRTVRADAPDPLTVRFQLPAPFAPFLEATSVPLLPDHLFGRDGAADLATHPASFTPVGAGPFRLTSFDNTGMTLVRHEGYHGPRPFLDQVELRFYPDVAAATRALSEGEVDGFAALARAELDRLPNRARLAIRESPLQGHTTYLYVNQEDPVLADTSVRRAISLTVDRAALAEGPRDGQAIPAYGPIPAFSWAYDRTVEIVPDPLAAARILDEAGWIGLPVRARNGRQLRLQLVTPGDDRDISLAEALAAQLESLGMRIEVQPVDTLSLYRERLVPRVYSLALVGVWLGTTDPDPYPLWHSSQRRDGFNFAAYASPDADQWLAAARGDHDRGRRLRALSAFQGLWRSDVPSLALISPVMIQATPLQLLGVRLGVTPEPSARFQHIAEWHTRVQRVVLGVGV